MGSSSGCFLVVATSFLLLLLPPAYMWQQLLGHMASLEQLFFPVVARACVFCSGTQGSLVAHAV